MKSKSRNAVRPIFGGILGHLGKKTGKKNWITNCIPEIVFYRFDLSWTPHQNLWELYCCWKSAEKLQGSTSTPASFVSWRQERGKSKSLHQASFSSNAEVSKVKSWSAYYHRGAQLHHFVCIGHARNLKSFDFFFYKFVENRTEKVGTLCEHRQTVTSDCCHFLTSTGISCLQWGLILSFLQLQF